MLITLGMEGVARASISVNGGSAAGNGGLRGP